MPGNKGRNAVGKGGDSATFPFHTLYSTVLSAGVLPIAVTPVGLSPRASIEADCWAHFRLKRLAFRLFPASTAASNVGQGAGFIGGIQDTPPTTITQVMELLPSTYIGADQTCPTEWVHVPRSDLAGPIPWYKTVAGTADPTEESPDRKSVV